MSGPYTIKWGTFGGPSWPESREEHDLEDALQVTQSNGGTIFDAKGNQLTAEDITAHQHPYRKLAEEIVGSLCFSPQELRPLAMVNLVLCEPGYFPQALGGWSIKAAVAIVEKCLEGSGL